MSSPEALELAGLGCDLRRVADAIEGVVHEQHTANLIEFSKRFGHYDETVDGSDLAGAIRKRLGIDPPKEFKF